MAAVRPRVGISRKTIKLVASIAAEAINVTAALVVLAPAIVVFIGAIVALITRHSVTAAVLGAVAGGGLSALVGGALILRPAFRRLTRGYRWETAEFIYRIDDVDTRVHTQTVKVRVVAISPWFRVFENRYHWTGRGEEEPPEVVSPRGARLLGPVNVGEWNYYYVHLGTALRIGEARDVEVTQRLLDRDGQFKTFLSKTVIEPIDHLTLRMLMPPHRFPALEGIRAFSGFQAPVDDQTALLPTINAEAGEIRLDVDRPVHGRRYWIEWDA